MNLSILIPFGSADPWRQRLFEWVQRRYEAVLPDAEIVIGTSETPFNRSAARNDAFRRSGGDIIVVADADTICPLPQLRRAIDMAGDGHWVLPYAAHNYYNLSERATARILEHDPSTDVHEPRNSDDWEFKLESWAGLLVMPRSAYEAAGTYDERFVGWGLEDNAFRVALDTMWGPHIRTTGPCLHLWHPTSEDARFGQPNIKANLNLYRRYQRASKSQAAMERVLASR
jgi:glycosyltransferase involved in cell wall biosynthesis